MTHHTDLAGADALVAEAQRDLELVLRETYVPRASEVANSEQARNVFLQLIAATRRNDPEREAVRKLAGMLGSVAKGVIVRALIRRVQRECLLPPGTIRTPLPLGIATPVPTGDENDRPTPLRPDPVKAAEDYGPDAVPSVPLKPNYTQGPWPLPPTKPVKPGRR